MCVEHIIILSSVLHFLKRSEPSLFKEDKNILIIACSRYNGLDAAGVAALQREKLPLQRDTQDRR